MEYISSFLNYAVSSVSHNSTQVPSDTITCFHYFKLNKNNAIHLHLAIGYERGFEVWDFQILENPQLLLSVRNSGVKKLIFSDIDPFGSLLITSLYQTLDFTLSSFHVFSLSKCKVTKIINTLKEIESIETSGRYIVCSTVNNSIELYQNFIRINVLNPFLSNIDSLRPVFALIGKTLAFTFVLKSSKAYKITGEIMNFASVSLESFLGRSALLTGSVYNQVSVVDIQTNTKVQEIHAFEVAVNYIEFGVNGKFMCLCPEHGQSFHIYRLEDIYILVYTLYRGVSLAKIINISFSQDESFIAITSNKGTSHLYTLEPNPKILTYKQSVTDRIKLDAIGCYYYNNQDLLILTKVGVVFLKTSEKLLHVCQVSRPIDFKCKFPVIEEFETPVECYN